MAKKRGPNGKIPPTGISWDGIRYRVRVPGMKSPVSAGQNEQAAVHLQQQLRRQVRDGTLGRGSGVRNSATLTEYVDHWTEDMQGRGTRSWKHLRGLVVNHVLPDLGKMQVRDIGQTDVRTWLNKVNRRMDREGGEPKTVHDIHRAFSMVMGLALADEIIVVNPCSNKHVRDRLPELSTEQLPCYSDEQAWALMTDEGVPWDRRMMNTIQALTGCRVGEAAGLRWSKYDRSTPELGCLLIDTQYQDQPLKTTRGKAVKRRRVPVHPQLARALHDWWEVGWETVFGRSPTDDGFIVPDRRDWTHARTPKQVISQHTKDIKRLDFYEKKMGTHSFRRYFETYAKLGGARTDILERITHNKRGTIVDVYIDTDKLWPALCEAVLCLKVDLSRGQVISLGGRRGSP